LSERETGAKTTPARSTDTEDGPAAIDGFDRLFWRRLWTIGANVVFSYVNRDMMTALTGGRATVFFHSLGWRRGHGDWLAPVSGAH
jgi:hypothetical protein